MTLDEIGQQLADLRADIARNTTPEVMTTEHAAAFLNVTTETLFRWRKDATGPAYSQVNGRTIHPTGAHRYVVEAQDGEVRCHPSDILSEKAFQIAFLEQNDQLWEPLGDNAFRDEIKTALANASTKATVSPERYVTANLWDFVHFFKTEDAAGIHDGQALHRDQYYLFKLQSFEAFLRTRGHSLTAIKLSRLLQDIGVEKRGNTMHAGKQVRPYAIHENVLALRYRDGQ